MDYNGFTGYGYQNSTFFNQKPPVPPPMAKSPSFNYGWPVTPGMPPMNNYGGQWVAPNQSSGTPGGGFPKKGRQGIGFNGRGFKRPHQAPKPFDPTGKTPAMLLHELFKEITEKYEEVSHNQTKHYKCVLTINGKEFSMEASSKKAAKQKASELAVRALRPDLPVTPYEEGVSNVQTVKKAQEPKQPAPNPYAAFVQPQQMSFGHPMVGVPPPPPPPAPLASMPTVKKNGPPSKKAKVQIPAVDSALSLVDALRKVCVERAASGPYNPIFEFEETTDGENTDKVKKKFICILSFPEKNIKYTAEAVGRNAPKDMACLKALKDEFGVTDSQIRAIMRRNVMGKGGDMPTVQTLHHVANLCHCTVAFKTEPVEPGIGIGTGRHTGFVCEITLTDHTQGDKVVAIKGNKAMSKHDAKEDACRKMLKQHFEIDPEIHKAQPQPTPPCQQLQVYCARRFKRNDSLLFEDLGTIGVKDHGSYGFKFKCVVDGRDFYGTGSSKKDAKNAAAAEAIRVVFGNNNPEQTSPECFELTEYVKREHLALCRRLGIEDIPTTFAAFVLVNAKNMKRMVSLAAVRPMRVHGENAAGANGTALHHLDPIILARRGLVRYFLLEIINFDPTNPANILEKGSDGMFHMKSDIRLCMYSTYSPGVYHSKPETEQRTLITLGQCLEAVGPEPQTIEEIKSTGVLKCFSPADKVFKWTHIGVQGALLTTLMHPVVLDTIYFGSAPHNELTDEDLKYSFFSRICPPARDVRVESVKRYMQMNITQNNYVFLRDQNTMEHLLYNGRKNQDGQPSSLCKASLYKLYLKANPNVPRDMPYSVAKARATEYNHNKMLLFEQLEMKGFGKWHQKPAELSDFTVSEIKEDSESEPIGHVMNTIHIKQESMFGSHDDSSVIDFSADT